MIFEPHGKNVAGLEDDHDALVISAQRASGRGVLQVALG